MDNFILQLLTNTDSTYTITFINKITIFCTYLNKAGMGHDVMTMKRLLTIKRRERNLFVKPKLAGP